MLQRRKHKVKHISSFLLNAFSFNVPLFFKKCLVLVGFGFVWWYFFWLSKRDWERRSSFGLSIQIKLPASVFFICICACICICICICVFICIFVFVFVFVLGKKTQCRRSIQILLPASVNCTAALRAKVNTLPLWLFCCFDSQICRTVNILLCSAPSRKLQNVFHRDISKLHRCTSGESEYAAASTLKLAEQSIFLQASEWCSCYRDIKQNI